MSGLVILPLQRLISEAPCSAGAAGALHQLGLIDALQCVEPRCLGLGARVGLPPLPLLHPLGGRALLSIQEGQRAAR